ncbi:rpgr, putative [Stigmatella aurantiaca DW4/3-1]|uniref:Rpgr, putative n=1 Tax=Stigmatella aurantiaca (strain DW4/3-1) TaxID=378806 RepID=Q095L4_STIAD|nr:rpgr, putative [Stigmatella aurantiaca DW4/3-1]
MALELALEGAVQNERPKGDEGCAERRERAAKGPVVLGGHAEQRGDEQEKEQPVEAAHHADGEGPFQEVLERHRDEEKGQEGQPFQEPDEAEAAERVHHRSSDQVGRKTISANTRNRGKKAAAKVATVRRSRETL